ncbi:ATP-dependent DNA helicase RecG [Pedobacter suwonensis]|uniref:ATP-dependent DNA helicase RecG n=1 Tax=Pedobacter suwonensis TaxID=332999 RepID=A0A1I0U5R2_9SPHI|nr:ATP-binding protein [Pedobacter suwonensis]SFA58536.1 ATP-dependent DNA helicase RecG [Pedobacter suwonensis]
MENILRLTERIEIATEIGESYYREFKSAFEGPPNNKVLRNINEVKYDIAKTLVAFANADGGELFVGIEDDNSVTGLTYKPEKIQEILNSPKDCILKDTPITLKQASLIDYRGLKVAYFSVSKGTEYVHLTAKGECFQRKDRESVPTASEKIVYQREEKISREYDREFVDIAKVTDLDHDLIENVAQRISKIISPEKLLQYLDLAEFDGESLKLRKAALLLFAKKSNRWHPRLQVRIFLVRGTEEKTGKDFNVTEVGEANGNIFQLIESSWDLLRPHLTDTKFSDDALFRTQIMYPELACREALVNAITHRDYSSEGRGIEVKIFNDRLVIENPGELLSSITIEDLKSLSGAHQSRNTYVARVLRETGYIRELGEGIRRIYELMNNNDMVHPEIKSGNKTYSITLFYKHVYTKEEQLWLEGFESLELSREQKTVVRLGVNGRLISAKEIFETVGIVDEKNYRELLESLRKINVLQSVHSQNELQNLRKKYGGSKKAVPRFRIHLPTINSNEDMEEEDRSDYARIYVGNIPYEIKEEELYFALGKFGEVVDVIIPRWSNTGQTKGFCFVEFDKRLSANNALNSTSPILISGKKLRLKEADKLK